MIIGVDRFSNFLKTNKNVVLRDHIPDDFLTRFAYSQANLGLSQLKSLEGRENRRINIGRQLKKAIY